MLNKGAVAEAITPLQTYYYQHNGLAGVESLLSDPGCSHLVRPHLENARLAFLSLGFKTKSGAGDFVKPAD